ncbi:MAG: tetratricopeptide repeat protein [Janthinobacterium lividum]
MCSRFVGFVFLVLGVSGLSLQAQQQAQDRRAFAAARAIKDPAQRVEALKQVAADYPGTGLAHQAAMLTLDTDLQSFPERTEEIHGLAMADVRDTAAGFERWSEEARISDLLASAGPGGADLPDAHTWAHDAVQALTEESYRRQIAAIQVKYKLDRLTPKQMHMDFLKIRASFLAALANVALREKSVEDADQALAEAYRLYPLSSEVSSLRGQLALTRHADREALDDFEHAEAEGDLQEPWRSQMLQLYKELGRGDEAGLNAEVDSLYGKLFPPAFTLPPRTLAAGGHTVLLELFTGAGCEPCVAPDLAVESLLASYTRQDLVVLEYDEHIPRPDPLANPDSVSRAAMYRVGTTPEAFLDGAELPVVGAARDDVENVVVEFADQVEDKAAKPSNVSINLTAVRGTDGAIQAQAALSGRNTDSFGPMTAHPIVRFALVEDGIRYSGENGIRFHRMVVRSMAKVPGPDVSATAAAIPVRTTFHPDEIAEDEVTYLNAFEKGSDRFGAIYFLTKNIPIRPDHLAVAAWVEDPLTHAILQSAYTLVASH